MATIQYKPLDGIAVKAIPAKTKQKKRVKIFQLIFHVSSKTSIIHSNVQNQVLDLANRFIFNVAASNKELKKAVQKSLNNTFRIISEFLDGAE